MLWFSHIVEHCYLKLLKFEFVFKVQNSKHLIWVSRGGNVVMYDWYSAIVAGLRIHVLLFTEIQLIIHWSRLVPAPHPIPSGLPLGTQPPDWFVSAVRSLPEPAANQYCPIIQRERLSMLLCSVCMCNFTVLLWVWC